MNEAILSRPIEECDLSTRCKNGLMFQKIYTIGQLTNKYSNQLLYRRYIGKNTIEEIYGYLKKFGLSLKDKRDTHHEKPSIHLSIPVAACEETSLPKDEALASRREITQKTIRLTFGELVVITKDEITLLNIKTNTFIGLRISDIHAWRYEPQKQTLSLKTNTSHFLNITATFEEVMKIYQGLFGYGHES